MAHSITKYELDKIDAVLVRVKEELISATEKFGQFNSVHEGLGVITEEYAELIDAIRSNNHDEIMNESIQVAAMAVRMVVDKGLN
jgi:NTP pyrophosphatase (non-canonical NTP hydrolase)